MKAAVTKEQLKMSTDIFSCAIYVLLVLFAKAEGTKTACCEDINDLLENKTTAYRTVCLGTDSRLSSNCCRNIEIEIEGHRFAYKMLCSAQPLPTPKIPTSLYNYTLIYVFTTLAITIISIYFKKTMCNCLRFVF